MDNWRLLDTNYKTAAQNMALDETLLKIKKNDNTPNTIRFLQFKPDCVLVGYHQSIDQELRLDFCRSEGIDINRRVTGGGTIYFDKTQIGWEIICDKDFFDVGIADSSFFNILSKPLITSLKKLGLNAEFRPRNDIEINGKKISGTGGTEEGNVFLFQGTLLVDFDIRSMIKALKIPIEKLKDKEIDEAKERVTCLRWELDNLPKISYLKQILKQSFEEEFKIDLKPGDLTESEQTFFEKILPKYESEEWINKVKYPKDEQNLIKSIYKAKGGLIRISLMYNKRNKRIQSAFITGDFFTYPNRIIVDLESKLKDVKADFKIVSKIIKDFFKIKKPKIPGVNSDDFIKAVKKNFEKINMLEYEIPLNLVNSIHTVNGSFNEIIKANPNHLLLPYCAKSLDCKFRYKRECVECGKCTISDAFSIGNKEKMWLTTILSFEDLISTLNDFRKNNVKSYIGCCCEAFYTKHFEDFQESKVPGILLDIDNTTCYDLGRQNDAYAGTFDSQTDLNILLLQKVIDARKI